MSRSNQTVGLLAVLTANLIWSGSFPAIAIATRDIPALFLTMIRLGTGALVLAPFLKLTDGRRWDKRSVGLSFLLGVGGFTLPVYLETRGVVSSSPALAAMSTAMEPLFTVLIAAMMFHYKIPRFRQIALFIAFFGAWAIAGFPRPGNAGYLTGDLLLLSGTALYAWYNVYSSRLIERIPPAAGAASTLLAGFITIVPLWLLSGANVPHRFSISDWLSVVYLAPIATGGAYLLWMLVLQRIQVSIAALFLYLQPILGVVLSVLFVGTQPTMDFYIGAVLILFAIYLGQEHRSRKHRKVREKSTSQG